MATDRLGSIGKGFLRYLECQRGNGLKNITDICACRLMIVAMRFQSLQKKVFQPDLGILTDFDFSGPPALVDRRSRFAAYVEGLVSVIGHADRASPLRDYCLG